MPAIPDPHVAAELRRLRTTAGLTLRDLATRTSYSHTYLWELERGKKPLKPDTAHRLDDELRAGGVLAALVDPAPIGPVDHEALDYAVANPTRVSPAAITALTEILARQRHLEDAMGAAPVIGPALAQVAVVERLADDAGGKHRPALVDLLGQWAQFAGWLHAAIGSAAQARSWYARALEAAAEVGSPDLTATALSMRGHLAWQAGQPGPLIGLSAAAFRQPAHPSVRAIAAQQLARGYALAGDGSEVEQLLDQAAELAEQREGAPAWVYFHGPAHLHLQRGLTYLLLRRHEQAIGCLLAGLDAMDPTLRRSEWMSTYVVHLARAYAAIGERALAMSALEDARQVAEATGSARLAGMVDRAARQIT